MKSNQNLFPKAITYTAIVYLFFVVIFYPLWGYLVVKFMLPDAHDGPLLRAYAMIPALITVVTLFFKRMLRCASIMHTISVLVPMLQFIWITSINSFDMIYVAGTFICMATISPLIFSKRLTIAFYTLSTLACIFAVIYFEASTKITVFYVAGAASIAIISTSVSAVLIGLINNIAQKNEALDQMAKVNMINNMAASMAHEINNPLTAIVASTTKMKRDLPERKEDIDRYIVGNANRISDIIHDISEFSKISPDNFQAEIFSNIESKSLVQSIESEIVGRYGIAFEDQTSSNNSMRGNVRIIIKALRNIVENARQATSHLDNASVEVRAKNRKGILCFEVRDNGHGIGEKDLERVFDPFYTKGDGVGLGLSYVHNAIKVHRGHVDIRREDKHTIVSISLPLRASLSSPKTDRQ